MPIDTVRVPDDIMCCSGCGFSTMAKASEAGWKGMELVPGQALFWYCPKVACQDAAEKAIVDWQAAQGYTAPVDTEDNA
jgi:hypothetical protein